MLSYCYVILYIIECYHYAQALTASALSGMRWTLAQVLTQKESLGECIKCDAFI